MGIGLLLALAFQIGAAERVSFPEKGLAAGYPGDAGIERDKRVVFVENFEHGSLEELWQRWDTASGREGMKFSDDIAPGSAGSKSLIMQREQGAGPQLYRRLKNQTSAWGFEKLFARYYVKFAEDCGEIHHFGTCLGGNNPPTPWPSVSAGRPTDGAKSFWSGIEPFGNRWVWDFYTYWCEMRGSPPRGKTWGNTFVRDDTLRVKRGEWICVEQMIKLNDPGDVNGEQALWIDGRLVAHLGKGFPKGLWTYDKFTPGKGGQGIRWNREKNGPETFSVPEGGAPFEGFRWRTSPDLNINFVWLYVYTQKPPGHRMKVWFDDVVLATEYIGPMTGRRSAK